ncbi:MAG: serine hydrolase domain-containing protein [Planctomycetota bacterium]
MNRILLPLLAATAALPAAHAQDARFPASTPLEEGLSPTAVEELSSLVQSFVDEGEIVGGELLVIKNGRSVLHRAYGLRDTETEEPLEANSVFCVRSMTKPLIGAAISMLVEDRLIKLDHTASMYLPSFDADSTRDITIEQLLTHTSGLPMSMIMAQDPRKLESVRAVADLGGGIELDTSPGTAFQYSDQGTDTLTAIIEVVTGAPAEVFIEEEILKPLGMSDTRCILAKDDPLRSRTSSNHAGAAGSWRRYWQPEDEALFPVFLGSQSLYSTTLDYARFLEIWMRRGRGPNGRLLRPSSVRRTLTPGAFPMEAPTGFSDAAAGYGSLMQVWTKAATDAESEEGDGDLVAFGHTGSDGTHAWAFPEQKAMVFYYTQSRGTLTGLRVEEALGRLLLGDPFDPIEAAPPLDAYLGYYREHDQDRYRTIVREGKGIALEILGKAVVPLVYAGGDRWKLKPQPGTVLEFDRNEAGDVTGYHIGDHVEYRFTPSADLPSGDEVAAKVSATHGVDRLKDVGPLRTRSKLTLPKLKMEGTRTSWYSWPDRWRIRETAAGETSASAYDGEAFRQVVGDAAPSVIEGKAADFMRMDGLIARFGDWRKSGCKVTVIQRISQKNGMAVLLVRLGDASAYAPTLYIPEDRWVVGRIDSMTEIPGLGPLGSETEFEDFEEVEGMLLPRHIEVRLANPMIGKIIVETEAFEVGGDVPEAAGHILP